MFTVKREELSVNNGEVDSGSHVSIEVMGISTFEATIETCSLCLILCVLDLVYYNLLSSLFPEIKLKH